MANSNSMIPTIGIILFALHFMGFITLPFSFLPVSDSVEREMIVPPEEYDIQITTAYGSKNATIMTKETKSTFTSYEEDGKSSSPIWLIAGIFGLTYFGFRYWQKREAEKRWLSLEEAKLKVKKKKAKRKKK